MHNEVLQLLTPILVGVVVLAISIYSIFLRKKLEKKLLFKKKRKVFASILSIPNVRLVFDKLDSIGALESIYFDVENTKLHVVMNTSFKMAHHNEAYFELQRAFEQNFVKISDIHLVELIRFYLENQEGASLIK